MFALLVDGLVGVKKVLVANRPDGLQDTFRMIKVDAFGGGKPEDTRAFALVQFESRFGNHALESGFIFGLD